MKKLIYLFGSLLIMIVIRTSAQNTSPDVKTYYDGSVWFPQTDTGITCSPSPPGIIRDDGTYENAYRSVTDGDSTTFVHKMNMPSMPVTLTAICVTWTILASSGTLGPYQLVIYDTLGPGGQPGNLIALVSGVMAPNILAFPQHSRYRYPVNITLTRRSYYIGVRWDNNPLLPFFISGDENGVSGGPIYRRVTSSYPPVWVLCFNPPNCPNLGIRAEGSMFPVFTGCRNGLNIFIPQFGPGAVDSVLVNLPGSEITDVNVRIDTVIHTWVSDLIFYLRRSSPTPVGVRIINQVGGSGDNFIGTILDDSASIPISAWTAPFTGYFRPSSPLTPFNGQYNTSAYWRLHISDTVGADTGFLRAWCVVISYQVAIGGIKTIEIPNSFRLYQNYPNPFNPSTKIKFGLPQNANVKLVVYDVLGREIAVLVNEFKHANTYEIDFDGTALPSGVYFYKLSANKFTAVRKMLLVK